MIRVTFYRNSDGSCAGFEVRGHAGAAEAGQDLVCAAVSALVTNAVNSVEQLTGDAFSFSADEETADMRLTFVEPPSKAADLLMRSLELGLTGIESEPSYQMYIDIIYEEV